MFVPLNNLNFKSQIYYFASQFLFFLFSTYYLKLNKIMSTNDIRFCDRNIFYYKIKEGNKSKKRKTLQHYMNKVILNILSFVYSDSSLPKEKLHILFGSVF
jgi:hypothetical protein